MSDGVELVQEAFSVISTHGNGCLEVRLVVAEDFQVWDALWTEYLVFYETTLPNSLHELTFKRYVSRADMKAFVAVDKVSGRCIGLANVIFHLSGWLEKPACYLQDLFVSPTERRRGVGRALLEHVAARVKEAGGARVRWLTKENNYRARMLYDTFADGHAPNGFIQYAKKIV